MESAKSPFLLPSRERGQQAEDIWWCVVGALRAVRGISSPAARLLLGVAIWWAGLCKAAGF